MLYQTLLKISVYHIRLMSCKAALLMCLDRPLIRASLWENWSELRSHVLVVVVSQNWTNFTNAPLLVSVPVSPLSKILIAKFTLEWTGSNMSTHMVLDITKLRKFLAASQALKLLVSAPTFRVERLELYETNFVGITLVFINMNSSAFSHWSSNRHPR